MMLPFSIHQAYLYLHFYVIFRIVLNYERMSSIIWERSSVCWAITTCVTFPSFLEVSIDISYILIDAYYFVKMGINLLLY